jgi:hypothetical protein
MEKIRFTATLFYYSNVVECVSTLFIELHILIVSCNGTWDTSFMLLVIVESLNHNFSSEANFFLNANLLYHAPRVSGVQFFSTPTYRAPRIIVHLVCFLLSCISQI